MSMTLPFNGNASLPEPGDNAAIANRNLLPTWHIVHHVLNDIVITRFIPEGHRFAVRPIKKDEFILSWGLPFGRALTDIGQGDYLANAKMLDTLRQREIGFPVPHNPNFEDYTAPFTLDEKTFTQGPPVPLCDHPATFMGFDRGLGRNGGTRNYLVVMGTSALTAGHAQALADRFCNRAVQPYFDGVVALAHTEGAGPGRALNHNVSVRTLAGFLANPNVGAFLALDHGSEALNNAAVQAALNERLGPAARRVPNLWLSLNRPGARVSDPQPTSAPPGARVYDPQPNPEPILDEAIDWIRATIPELLAARRVPLSLSHLEIALQCGGSDAFNGISANPLIGTIALETVRNGGIANLCETDELIGAEPDILSNVKDLPTARAFLRHRDQFQQRAAWHGHSAEGNPSGGNLFRGLYNIAIKSIGAARKRHPALRLDHVIDYAEPMPKPGFYFMNSPGNDLESIAGQVASGCNLILFATGNGSITNFPFVPTLKVMTTTARFNLLRAEMDINAGRYLDGEPMETLAHEAFQLTLETASGLRSAGEKAGHAQAQLWREWRQDGTRPIGKPFVSSGSAIPLPAPTSPASSQWESTQAPTWWINNRPASRRIRLLLPTSLCSGQIAALIASKLRAEDPSIPYIALPHTEGCGVSSGECERLLLSTMTGYLCHPAVESALLIEHGCEKTHNDAFKTFFAEQKIDPARFGYASIQADGGLEKVTARVQNWFHDRSLKTIKRVDRPLNQLRLGLLSSTPPSNKEQTALAQSLLAFARCGSLVLCENDPLLAQMGVTSPPNLDYGQPATRPGLSIMHAPTPNMIERLTGLGATGVDAIVIIDEALPWPSHPFIPTRQISWANTAQINTTFASLIAEAPPPTPTAFQITRGRTGISL